MPRSTVSVVLQPAVPFKPQLINQDTQVAYFGLIIREYFALTAILSKLKPGQMAGAIINPQFLSLFQTDHFKDMTSLFFAQLPPEGNTGLIEEWGKWNGDVLQAFRYFQQKEVFAIFPAVFSDYPLTLLQTDCGMRSQMEKTLSLYRSCMGSAPESIWLPGCAYTAGMDIFMKQAGIPYIFLDESALPNEAQKGNLLYYTACQLEVRLIRSADTIQQAEEMLIAGCSTVHLHLPANESALESLADCIPSCHDQLQMGVKQVVPLPFSYKKMNDGFSLISEHQLLFVASGVRMEERLRRIPKNHPYRMEMEEEWMHYLYAVAHDFSKVEKEILERSFFDLADRKQQDNTKTEWKTADRGVLLLSWEYPPRVIGGLARHVHDLAKALAQDYQQVFVVTAACEGAADFEENEGVLVYRTGPLHQNEPDFLKWVADLNGCLVRKAAELIEMENIGIIHAHDWLVGHAALICKEVFVKPLVTTVHATEYGRNNGILTGIQKEIILRERQLYQSSDYLIVCSQPMKEEVEEHYLEEVKPLAIIPNGVFLDQFTEHTESLAPFRWRRYQPFIFSIGRMVNEKGFHILIDAAAQVIKTHNIQFVIAGKGPLLEFCREKVAKSGLEDHIHFIGFVTDDERRQLFAACEAAVFPSLYEPFGIVALEAMASKKPVIASDTGGLKTFVIHEQTGLLARPGDPAALKIEIACLLNDQNLRERIRMNGYQIAKSLYSWERISKRTQKVYNQAIINKNMEGVRQ